MRTKSSGPAETSLPHRQAVDMTALETFTTASKQPLTTGRRPDMTAICALLPSTASAPGGRESARSGRLRGRRWTKPTRRQKALGAEH